MLLNADFTNFLMYANTCIPLVNIPVELQAAVQEHLRECRAKTAQKYKHKIIYFNFT